MIFCFFQYFSRPLFPVFLIFFAPKKFVSRVPFSIFSDIFYGLFQWLKPDLVMEILKNALFKIFASKKYFSRPLFCRFSKFFKGAFFSQAKWANLGKFSPGPFCKKNISKILRAIASLRPLFRPSDQAALGILKVLSWHWGSGRRFPPRSGRRFPPKDQNLL